MAFAIPAGLIVAPFVLPIVAAVGGSGLIAGIFGGIFGNDDKRDLAANDLIGPVIFNINSSNVDSARFHQMTVLADQILANETAIFKYGGEHGVEEAVGRLTGFPSKSDKGVMQGGFSVKIPGLESALEGTWLSVRDTVETAEKTAFNGLVDLLVAVQQQAEEEKEQAGLEDILADMVKAVQESTPICVPAANAE